MELVYDFRLEKFYGGKINIDCNFENYESRKGEGIVMGIRVSWIY